MKKTMKLFVLWIIVFALFTAAILFSSTMYAMDNHLPKKDLPEQVKLILDVVILVIFCPTLAFIGKCAKNENENDIERITRMLLLFLFVVAVGNVISIIF